jgi:hypothetical protein
VRFSGAQRTGIDGPFKETKEPIAGFWLWQVKLMAEAIERLGIATVRIKAPFEGASFDLSGVKADRAATTRRCSATSTRSYFQR